MLLSVFDLSLDIEGQKFDLVVDVLGHLGLALRGQLTAVHGHVGQPVMVKMHCTRFVKVHLFLL